MFLKFKKILYNIYLFFESKTNDKYVACHFCKNKNIDKCNICAIKKEMDNDLIYQLFDKFRKKYLK